MEGDKNSMLMWEGPEGEARIMMLEVMRMNDPESEPVKPKYYHQLCLEELTKKYIADNPDHDFEKCVKAIGKAWDGKWKSMSNAERRPYVPVPREIKLDKAKEYKAKKKAYDEKNKVAGEVSDVPDAKLAGKSMSIIGYEKAVEKMNKKNSPYMAMADYLAKVEAYNKNKKVAVGPADEESGKSKSEVEADDKNQSGEEKAPCVAKAEKRKTEYNENVDVYNKKVAVEPVDDEESDKSKYKVEADEAQSGEEEDLNDD